MESTIPVEILVSSDQKDHDPRAFKTVRVSVHAWNAIHTDPWGEFKPSIRRVDFDKVPALLSKLEAKYTVHPTSHHREQYALLARLRVS